MSNQAIQMGIGGLAYGFAVKQGWVNMLPAIPIVGRTGAAAILLTWASRRGFGGEIVRNAGLAAATMAGYQLGSTGAIVGDEYQYTSGLHTGEAYEDGYADD